MHLVFTDDGYVESFAIARVTVSLTMDVMVTFFIATLTDCCKHESSTTRLEKLHDGVDGGCCPDVKVITITMVLMRETV